jgi:RNA polymerase sigma factor (sigma-70 family)
MSTWFTTLTAIRAARPDWAEIACYREPIARFLARVYPRLPGDVRDDIVQEVICAMHTSVVARFQPERGRFRDYLRGVIQNQVRAAQRKRREVPLQIDPVAVAQAPAEDVDALDLQARIVRAVRAFHDDTLQGSPREREVLYCLSDRLIEGLGYEAIAAKEGISRDAVKRRLQAARRGVLRALLAGALDDRGLELKPRALSRLAERVAEAVTTRRPATELPGRGLDPAARATAVELVERVRLGVRWFPGLDSPDGQGFVTALRAVLEEER